MTLSVDHQRLSVGFRPMIRSHLTLPKKKVLELEQALLKANIVVVQGPSGSGKHTAVTVIAQDLGFSLCEWNGPSGPSTQLSLSRTFLKFLSTRLTPLLSVSEAFPPEPHEPKSLSCRLPKRCIRVVKEIPFTLYNEENPQCLKMIHATKRLLWKYASKESSSIVLVFIIGDQSFESRWFRCLFSHLESCRFFAHLRINLPTRAALKRVWQRFASSPFIQESPLKKSNFFSSTVPMESYSGELNLNQFLLHLQFPTSWSPCFKNPSTTSCAVEPGAACQVMHAAARILWNKRLNLPLPFNKNVTDLTVLDLFRRPSYICMNEVSRTFLSSPDIRPQQLPNAKLCPKILRPPLYYDLDELLLSLHDHLRTIVDLLYTNYVYFFSEMDDVAELLNQMVAADAWTLPFDHTKEWICIKAALDANLHPVSPYLCAQQQHTGKQNTKTSVAPKQTSAIFSLRPPRTIHKQTPPKGLLSGVSGCSEQELLIHGRMALWTDIIPSMKKMFHYGKSVTQHQDVNLVSLRQNAGTPHDTDPHPFLDLMDLSESDLEPEDEIEPIDF